MNLHRGLFRIWIVYAVVVLIIAVVTHQDRLTFREFAPPQYVQDPNVNALVTIACAAASSMTESCRPCEGQADQYRGLQEGCARGNCMRSDQAEADQEVATLLGYVGVRDVNPIICQGINDADLIRWSPTKIGILAFITLLPLLIFWIVVWIRRGFQDTLTG